MSPRGKVIAIILSATILGGLTAVYFALQGHRQRANKAKINSKIEEVAKEAVCDLMDPKGVKCSNK